MTPSMFRQILEGCKGDAHQGDRVQLTSESLNGGLANGGLRPFSAIWRTIGLRASGTLTSEPQSSTPCDMRFSPSDRGKMAILKRFLSEWPFSLYRLGQIAYRRG